MKPCGECKVTEAKFPESSLIQLLTRARRGVAHELVI
jgi:hypothetical protein